MSTSYGAGQSGPQPDSGAPRAEGGSHEVRAARDRRSSPEGAGSVLEQEKERFGGVKVGSAFFGWLTATGMAILLTAVLAAAGTAVGVATNTDVASATAQATNDPKTVGIVGAVILVVILLVAYYCGGYVAGRMARFNGARQGLAVWLWAVVIAVVVAIVGAVAGSKYNVLAQLNSFPRIPVGEGQLSGAGLLALLVVAVASLVGAVLGGLAGMRFHRRVDQVRNDELRRRVDPDERSA